MPHSDLFATLSASLEELESDILQLEESPDDLERMARIFQTLGLESQHWAGEQARQALIPLKEGRVRADQNTVDALLGLVEAFKRLFFLAAGEEVQGQAEPPQGAPEAAPISGEAAESQPTTTIPQATPPKEPGEPPASAPWQPAKPQREQSYIKVSTRKLDELMESVQELVISSTMMGQRLERTMPGHAPATADSAVGELQEHDRCIEAIRKHVLDIRKISLAPTCTRMARLVREVAANVGKQVELVAQGQDVEVDKSILDDLADPLVHLLRNAVDHGIEPPEEREAAGKPPQGEVRLLASQEDGELVLRIEDDGRGLNRRRIFEKARQRGLLPPDAEEAAIPDKLLYNLVLQPGFSTAEKVSNVSGRGVGMDVVAQSLRAMHGELEIASQEGQGSRFIIRVPSDKASLEGITQGLLVDVGGQHFVLRSGSVRGVFSPQAGSVHALAQEGEVVDTREGTLPFYRTHFLLEIPPRSQSPEQGLAVVVESGQEQMALLVDDVLGERQVVVRTFAGMKTFLGESLFSGVAFIGRMTAMILDTDHFIRNARQGDAYLGCRFAACSSLEAS